jgi:hypothetical protein
VSFFLFSVVLDFEMILVSARIECTVKYADELSSDLQSTFPGALDRNIMTAIETVANRILDTARILVPVRTGFLLSTIGSEVLARWAFTIYARAPYAGYVEWGTFRMYARLYMTRAIEQHQGELPQEIDSAVRQSAQECGVISVG